MRSDFDTLNTDQQWPVVYVICVHSCQNGGSDQHNIFAFIIGHTKLLHFVTHNSYVWKNEIHACASLLEIFTHKNVSISFVHAEYFANGDVCPPTNPIRKYIFIENGELSIVIQTE